MANQNPPAGTFMMDLATLNQYNAQGCAACGNKFNLGDSVVAACGDWGKEARLIHAHEATRDPVSGGYVDRRCLNR